MSDIEHPLVFPVHLKATMTHDNLAEWSSAINAIDNGPKMRKSDIRPLARLLRRGRRLFQNALCVKAKLGVKPTIQEVCAKRF
jgi:hypothetical protein